LHQYFLQIIAISWKEHARIKDMISNSSSRHAAESADCSTRTEQGYAVACSYLRI
jgi:hypothetical protein